jgi:diketogulonate reductase-like aldo/keto reductase
MTYGLFGGRDSSAQLLHHPIIESIATELHTTCTSVLLSWARAKGLVVVFGSSDVSHIRENVAATGSPVSLTPQHIANIDSMEGDVARVFGWKGVVDLDSVDIGFTK